MKDISDEAVSVLLIACVYRLGGEVSFTPDELLEILRLTPAIKFLSDPEKSKVVLRSVVEER